MVRPLCNIVRQRGWIILAAVLLLASPAAAQTTASQIPDGFLKVELKQPQPPSSTLLAALGRFTPSGPESMEGNYGGGLLINPDGDRYMVNASEHGYLDDSVKGQSIIAFVALKEEGWVLEEVYRKFICYRGEPNEKGLCP